MVTHLCKAIIHQDNYYPYWSQICIGVWLTDFTWQYRVDSFQLWNHDNRMKIYLFLNRLGFVWNPSILIVNMF